MTGFSPAFQLSLRRQQHRGLNQSLQACLYEQSIPLPIRKISVLPWLHRRRQFHSTKRALPLTNKSFLLPRRRPLTSSPTSPSSKRPKRRPARQERWFTESSRSSPPLSTMAKRSTCLETLTRRSVAALGFAACSPKGTFNYLTSTGSLY